MKGFALEVDEDGRWIIGRRNAPKCPNCGAPPEATHAQNGRAEIWHAPFFCCDDARRRNARMRQIDEVTKEEQAWTSTNPDSRY